MSDPSHFSRRGFLKSSVGAIAAFGVTPMLPGLANAASHVRMPNPLIIPPLDQGRMEDGVRVYDLALQNGTSQFFSDVKTPTSGVNGAYLGPTLNMRDGDNVRINVTNELGERSTLHWHGMHLPAAQDGGPHQVVADGTTWSPEFTVRQSAASLWYHPHLMGKTAEHVWRGMAGMVIVNDDESDGLNLPSGYGVDDIPLILQDRSFSSDGRMDYRASRHSRMMGMMGNIPLANGTIAPFFQATTTRVRLRILNASNASTYFLGFDTGQRFHQIGTDGGLLEAPVLMDELRLGPAERAEILVELEPGREIVLQNRSRGGGGMMSQSAPAFNFLKIAPVETLSPSAKMPQSLASIDWLNESDAVKSRRFDLEMVMGPQAMLGVGKTHTINGKSMKLNRIDETVNLGDTEIWVLRNTSRVPHPFHMHDVQFQILDRNGRLPAANEKGRKDVVLIGAGEVVRIIMRFEDYSDPDSPFMYHCHILEHEDVGMMGQFVVV